MTDLDDLSLEMLIRAACQAKLIDAFRTTEWVAALTVGDEDLVLNHTHARIFLHGLIRGALRTGSVEMSGAAARLDDVYP